MRLISGILVFIVLGGTNTVLAMEPADDFRVIDVHESEASPKPKTPVPVESPKPAPSSETNSAPEVPKASKIPFRVIWFKPYQYLVTTSNFMNVALFGRTAPGTWVTIDRKQMIFANLPTDLSQDKSQQMISAKADSAGYFKIILELPIGLVQFPVLFSVGESDAKTVLLIIDVQSKKSIKLNTPQERDTNTIAKWRADLKEAIAQQFAKKISLTRLLRGWWAQAGVGVSYQAFSQSLSDGNGLKYANLSYPALVLNVVHSSEKWMGNIEYKRMPGKVSSVTTPYTLSQSSYNWENYTAQVGYHSEMGTYRDRMRLTYLGGLQYHKVPFFRLNFGNNVTIENHTLINLSAGPMIWLKVGKRMFFESYLRYQYPVSSNTGGGIEIRVKPEFSFDGSVGLIYRLTPKSMLGFDWYGQWHRYKFSYSDPLAVTSFGGEENLFYSSIDCRYTIHFR